MSVHQYFLDDALRTLANCIRCLEKYPAQAGCWREKTGTRRNESP